MYEFYRENPQIMPTQNMYNPTGAMPAQNMYNPAAAMPAGVMPAQNMYNPAAAMPMQNMYNPAAAMPAQNMSMPTGVSPAEQLESMYPQTYNIIQPEVEKACNKLMEKKGDKCPTKAEVEAATNEIYNKVEPAVESAVKTSPSAEERQFYGGGRRILRDFVGALLITNLIDNSIKASKDGDKIYLSAYKDNKSNVILEVKDVGYGIPVEDIPKVTEPFYMVDKSRERSNKGIGLGLSLCSQIAKLHNADIVIESSKGSGATIQVVFKI
jgi:hypothetical protein